MAWLADERQHDVARPIKKKERGGGGERGQRGSPESTIAVFPARAPAMKKYRARLAMKAKESLFLNWRLEWQAEPE